MKYTLPLAFASLASANIIFNHVDLWCDLESAQLNHGCLRGQVCTEDHKCVTPNEEVSYNEHIEVRAVYSTDGTCGAQNGGTLCDPNATAYSGICCSQYGWCGSTDAYCGDGCQSNCTTAATSSVPASSSTSAAAGTATSATSTAPRDDGRCGVDFGGATCEAGGPYGGCCSSYGYCGTTDAHCLVSEGCQSGCSGTSSSSSSSAAAPSSSSAADSSGTVTATPTQSSGEPVIQPTTATSPTSTANAEVTTDGTCGAAYNHTVCGDWPQGSCCSMYGYCGNTSAHCGEGCQSGNCTTTPSAEAPGASPAPAAATQGSFNITGRSGVPAMHMALMPNGRVMFLDKIENYTELTLSSGYYAYSSEYNPEDNTVVPLAYKTNAFCSGGSFLADGRVVSLGGNANLEWLDPTVTDGWDGIRYLDRSSTDASLDGQDWSEPGNKLASNRWYATAQTMGDGTLFVASGSLNGLDPTVPANNNPTYEILSADAVSSGVNVPFEILEKNQPYYMYPFIHLLRDGTLFVFASKSSEQFNVGTNTTVQSYPDLAGDYRTYPNTGGSVLLPLSSANNYDPDVIICGGGAYQDITSPTDPSCGRIQPLSTNPTWEMDSMPEGRGMVEGTLLPDGTIVWLNGGNEGAQGFGLMQSPTLEALLYNGSAPLGSRFKTLASSTIPRLYHSVATLLLDGTLMVAGSNPVEMPVLQASAANPFVTEFRVEIYTPPYLQGDKANKRPTNVALSSKSLTANGQTFTVTFTAPSGAQKVQAVLYHGGFVTHSVHMGHRMINLDSTGWAAGSTSQTLTVTMPPNTNVAPPGPYVVYIMVDGVPSIGQFVMVA